MSIINKLTNIVPKKFALMLITLVIAVGSVFGSVLFSTLIVDAETVLGKSNNITGCYDDGGVNGCGYDDGLGGKRLNCLGAKGQQGACADPVTNSYYNGCTSKPTRANTNGPYFYITCTNKLNSYVGQQNNIRCLDSSGKAILGGPVISNSNGSCEIQQGKLSNCVDIGSNYTYMCELTTSTDTSKGQNYFLTTDCNPSKSSCQNDNWSGTNCSIIAGTGESKVDNKFFICSTVEARVAETSKVAPTEDCTYNAAEATCVTKDGSKVYTQCQYKGNLLNVAGGAADKTKPICNPVPKTVIGKCVGAISAQGTCKDSSGNTLSGCTTAGCVSNTSGTKIADGKAAGEGDIFAWIANIVLGLLTLLLWLAIQFAKFALGVMGGMFVVLVSVNPASNELLNVAYRPWQSVVNIANIFLIAGIIFMGFGYILNLDFIKKSQGLQNFFLGILTVGVMMQFTFAASAAVVNFSNGIGNIIYFGAGGIAQPSVAPAGSDLKACLDKIDRSGDSGIGFVNTFVCSVSQVSPITATAEAGRNGFAALFDNIQGQGASRFVTTGIALAIFILAIFSFWKVLVILLVRIFGLWILIVVSPLALVAAFSPLPQMKDISSKWFDNFMRLSFSYPFYTFGITLVTLMIGSVSTAIQEGAKKSGLGSLPDGSIDTYAQGVSGAGVAVGNIAGKIVKFDDTLVVTIIIAVFSLGLVAGFGILFTKIFGVIYDAVAKAAGTAMAVTRGTLSAGKGAIGGGLGIASKFSSAAGDKLKTLGDKLATNPNPNFRSKGLGNLVGGLGNSLKASGTGLGVAKGVTDLGFDAARFAIDTPGGIINAGKKIYGGFKKSSDKVTQQNQQMISNLAESTGRQWGFDKELDLMDDPSYRGMNRDAFNKAENKWKLPSYLGSNKNLSDAFMRYGIPPEWSKKLGDKLGQENAITARQDKQNRKRNSQYSMNFEELDGEERVEMAQDLVGKLDLKDGGKIEDHLERLKNIGPEEFNLAKGLFESLADRPEILAEMALDNRFKALAQTVYGSMNDEAAGKFKFSGLNLLNDDDAKAIVSKLTTSDKRKLSPDVLKDPRIKSYYQDSHSDYDTILDKATRSKMMDGSQTVSEGAIAMGNRSAKKAYGNSIKKEKLDTALGAVERESKSFGAMDSGAFKGIFDVAYQNSEYNPATGKFDMGANAETELSAHYDSLMASQFGKISSIDDIQKTDLAQLRATQAGQDVEAVFDSAFKDVKLDSAEGEQLYKAMFHSVYSTATLGKQDAIAGATLAANSLNDSAKVVSTQNIALDKEMEGVESLQQHIAQEVGSRGVGFDVAVGNMVDALKTGGRGTFNPTASDAEAAQHRLDVIATQAKAVHTSAAKAIAKSIARGQTGGAVIGDSYIGDIERAVHKIQTAKTAPEIAAAEKELDANINTVTEQLKTTSSPTKRRELQGALVALGQIKTEVAKVVDVYHKSVDAAGNDVTASAGHKKILDDIGNELKKAATKLDARNDTGGIDVAKSREALVKEKQRISDLQKSNRESFRSALPNAETTTSLLGVLRDAARVNSHAAAKTNIGTDLLTKA